MRANINDPVGEGGGRYYRPSQPLELFSSGCRLLDCILGGGWALGRISNIVGDRSTNKTGLTIEASNSFARTYPRGRIRYAESEAAFLKDYAGSIGMPLDRIDFTEDDDNEFLTVKDFYQDLEKFLSQLDDEPGLYILDTLDALSTDAEHKREFGEGTYGTEKAREMGMLFRRCVRAIKNKRVHLMVVSQERDNIGVTFGKKSTRSGGRALDFYASQVLWLAKKETLYSSINSNKIKRATGLVILANCEKNKISMPFGKMDFSVRFNYGIDEVATCLDWLKDVGREEAVLQDLGKTAFINRLNDLSNEEYWAKLKEIGDTCADIWAEIEERFAPKRSRV